MGVPGFGNPFPIPGQPGAGAPPQFEDFFNGVDLPYIPPQSGEQGFVPITVQDMYEDRLNRGDTEGANALMSGFQVWALGQGAIPDANDIGLSQAYMSWIFGEETGGGGGGGGYGPVQFPSEAELDYATAELRRQQAATEEYNRQLLEQQAATERFNRARDKFSLLQATDQLADARREIATQALIDALPYMVSPGQQYTPGFEPFGAGPVLGDLLGANVPARELPTTELPLNELANPPLAAPPEAIEAGLGSLL